MFTCLISERICVFVHRMRISLWIGCCVITTQTRIQLTRSHLSPLNGTVTNHCSHRPVGGSEEQREGPDVNTVCCWSLRSLSSTQQPSLLRFPLRRFGSTQLWYHCAGAGATGKVLPPASEPWSGSRARSFWERPASRRRTRLLDSGCSRSSTQIVYNACCSLTCRTGLSSCRNMGLEAGSSTDAPVTSSRILNFSWTENQKSELLYYYYDSNGRRGFDTTEQRPGRQLRGQRVRGRQRIRGHTHRVQGLYSQRSCDRHGDVSVGRHVDGALYRHGQSVGSVLWDTPVIRSL